MSLEAEDDGPEDEYAHLWEGWNECPDHEKFSIVNKLPRCNVAWPFLRSLSTPRLDLGGPVSHIGDDCGLFPATSVRCRVAGGDDVVYVLCNEAMPGVVKVGRSSNLARRIEELSKSTSAPAPFRLVWASSCFPHSVAVERAAHHLLHPFRINPAREFFKASFEIAMSAVVYSVAACEDHRCAKDLRELFIQHHLSGDGP